MRKLFWGGSLAAEARSEELDGLKQGMGVLSGANFGAESGFLQARK